MKNKLVNLEHIGSKTQFTRFWTSVTAQPLGLLTCLKHLILVNSMLHYMKYKSTNFNNSKLISVLTKVSDSFSSSAWTGIKNAISFAHHD